MSSAFIGPSTTVVRHSASSAVDLEFRNESSETIDVYWRDYNGEEVYYFSLSPNDLPYFQSTFVTHPWIIKRAGSDDVIMTVIAGGKGRGEKQACYHHIGMI
ncbi:MAG: hypothetical protein KDI02_03400, partial [Anaerolineae bacterium]|nr:hypothetical protein [Anaerolineae bacterium]